MDRVKASTQNWVDFATLWEPSLLEKEAFAAWSVAQNQRYMYWAWDSDGQAIVGGSTICFGAIAKTLEYDGVYPVYNNVETAVMAMGTIASIDYSKTNGRITTAFRKQSGFTPVVTDSQIATNLLDNGYSFYGQYGNSSDTFSFFYNGQGTGKWKWADTFIDQVWLNANLQAAGVNLLTQVNSIPYNEAGYSMIRVALKDTIDQALNAGVIRTGITLSSAQSAQVNAEAGRDVTMDIEQHGYYLQVLDPGADVRANRGTPIINLWYTDGGAVQKITMSSVDIM